MPNFQRVEACRICGNRNLAPVIDLGDQYLTGVFPASRDDALTHGPLELVRCAGDEKCCGLVQLQHEYDSAEMYGEGYGYRSSLNRAMVTHLERKAAMLMSLAHPGDGDLVLDIGSNDGTLLSFYPGECRRVGMDPSAAKLKESYPRGAECIVDYFSRSRFEQEYGGQKAQIVTSIAMFYDLADPQSFGGDIAGILDKEGIWHFEQSYMPSMLDTTGYDTICHEHVEYYAFSQIEWMLEKAGLRAIDVELNDVNGGSFAITACLARSSRSADDEKLNAFRQNEAELKLRDESTYARFRDRVMSHRDSLTALLHKLKNEGKLVIGYGASTKGNVMLQFCGFDSGDIPFIAEVNTSKFGCLTPGSLIPIISEAEAHALNPEYLLVMPWHFRKNLIEREKGFLNRGGRMIFPLPELEIVTGGKSE